MVSQEQEFPVGEGPAEGPVPPLSLLEAIRDEVAGLLGCRPQELRETENLIERGMDSIRTMSLAGWLRRQGVPAAFPELAERPTLADWSALVRARMPAPRQAGHPVPPPAVSLPERPERDEPFPLTPMQHAYWIGRRDDRALGSVGCHAYFEFDGTDVDAGRLETAVRDVLARHGMLRARFLDDGTQCVMRTSPWPGLVVHDLRDAPGNLVGERLTAVRDELSHRRLRVETGETLDVRLTLLPGGATRVHLDVDLLVTDVAGIRVLLADLARAYRATGGEADARPTPANGYGFADYLADQADRRADERVRARAHWQERLADLPDGPALPLAHDPARLGPPRFTRRSHRLDPTAWRRFTRRAHQAGVTPAMALAAAYAETLAAYSETPRFLLGVPLFDRDAVHPAVPGMVADFTSLLLLPVDLSAPMPFRDRALAVQRELRSVAAHSAYTGVEVLRDLNRGLPNGSRQAPVVFACTLGDELAGDDVRSVLGEPGWAVSQTPQVWLDHQVYESRGGLDLCWDSVDALFPPGVIDDMFGAYRDLVDRLAAGGPVAEGRPETSRERLADAGGDAWDVAARPGPPDRQLATRGRANATGAPRSGRCLHEEFFTRAAGRPGRPALRWGTDGELSYGGLARRALGVAAVLRDQGVRPGEPVVVSAPAGAERIAAVLGVLAAGAAYLPLGVDQPPLRRRRVLERSGARLALTAGPAGAPASADGLPDGITPLDLHAACGHEPLAAPVPVSPDSPAYVIFTSGTTGEPKGVVIAHAAAVNTVDDINDRFGIGPADRTLGVSALDFDLSVYDLFGPLSAGGALVLVDDAERRDPAAWAASMARHRVTVWNSVPVLLDMLLTTIPAGGDRCPRLRLALVSGDWIGLDLPERLAARTSTGCRFAALGGATEAAIWSNLTEVTEVDPTWTSIPYGRPLRNQRFRVAGPDGGDRPDWVPGELWIGGAGLALGYLGDPALTARKFVTHQGTRWYRTGDRGRYWPDGTLEFLGRVDRQVKIRGVRTEPGEVRAALESHPSVGGCVVAAVGGPRDKRLVAVVRPATEPAAARGDAGTHAPLPAPSVPAEDRVPPAGTTGPTPRVPVPRNARADAGTDVVERFLARLVVAESGVAATPTPLGELARRWGATAPWLPLLTLWLDWLVQRDVLTAGPDGYAAGPRLTAVTAEGTDGGPLAAVADRLASRAGEVAAVLRGENDPLLLLDDPVLAPAELSGLGPGASGAHDALLAGLPAAGGTGEVAVLGASAGLLRRLAGHPARPRCTVIDGSSARLETARRAVAAADTDGTATAAERFAFLRVPAGHLPADLLGRFDAVVADNTLHAGDDPAAAVVLAAQLLRPDGTLLALERTELPALALVSAALPTVGFTTLDALRGSRRTPLLPAREWRPLLRRAGLVPQGPPDAELPHGHLLLRAAKAPGTGLPDGSALRAWLAERLPAAMIPDHLYAAAGLPLTANGKVDQAALERLPSAGPAPRPGDAQAPRGPGETALATAWRDLLGLEHVGREQDFFSLGGDSLLATRLVSRLRAGGFAVDLAAVFASPVLKDLAPHLSRGPERTAGTVVPDPGHRFDPFPSTDVQRAYWTGRAAGLPLGGVGAHYYTEFDGPALDLGRLETAWNTLIARHEMLRAVFDDNGDQRVLPTVAWIALPVREAAPGHADEALAGLRDAMSHQVRDPARWPLVDLRAVTYEREGERRVRLGLSLENIVLDGRSMMIVLAELERLYREPDAPLPPVGGLTFRDYVLQASPGPGERDAARQYWRERLADLPAAPALPLAARPAEVGAGRFVRRSGLLPAARWRAVTDRARQHGVTPSAVLLACYAEVLGRWSTRPDLTVNLTLFDRRDVHPGVDDIVGDFTSLLPVAYRPDPRAGFLDRVRALQQRLGQDLAHRAWSGVRVAREFARAEGAADAAWPVVFTSAIGTPRALSLDLSDWLLPRVWGVSQTPQTWLDNQVYDSPRGLHYDWDAVRQLLNADVVDAMFAAYGRLLEHLADADWDAPVPDLLPAGQRAVRRRVNTTAGPLPDGGLHEEFFRRAEREPERTALLWEGGRLGYAELALRARRIAGMLRALGTARGEAVAVTLPKGPDQIAAVLGVLAAGGVYVPVGPDQPPARRSRLYARAGARRVLVDDPRAHRDVAGEGVTVLAVGACERYAPVPPMPAAAEASAYVIFTSGTTGDPKGVEVCHRAAANTVLEINERFGVRAADRHLGLSALDFDLSVYDIFGPLSAGGALVLIGEDERRDPERWLEHAVRHGVTVWNSVPTLLDMALTVGGALPRTLRLVLVSGDWVGLDLRPRLSRRLPDCRLVALGGATEAAIWSNFHEVTRIPASWTSVPYGRPLRNQFFRVVDASGRDCPDRVPGQLWIGGAGLATGYRGDPEGTREKFVRGADGLRYYRTGDVGRYWPDGTLEFLGRTDQQVKINGHRVEPAEIQAVLDSHPAVRHSVVTAATAPGGPRAAGGPGLRLLAHAVPAGPDVTERELLDHLAERLPRHCVPDTVLLWDAFPLTANGKIDRAALAATAAPATAGRVGAGEPPRTSAERLAARVWADVLGVPEPSRDDDFFALGGDSLLATRVVAGLRAAGVRGAAISGLFTARTLAAFAATTTPADAPRTAAATLVADPTARHQPFAPTALQRAYWVGRSPAFTLGGVGSYYYCEFDEDDLDLPRLEAAWNALIARHEMLRAVFDEDGDQRVLPDPGHFTVQVSDAPDGAAGEALADLRSHMSHQVLDPSVWPLFDVRAVRYGAGRTRVGIGLDYLLVDGLSMMILFSELDRLYQEPDAALAPIGVSFRDYVQQADPGTAERDRSTRYWRRRLPDLPPPPALPLATDPAAVRCPRFERHETWLPPERWQALRSRARRAGLTPSAVLLTCYAEVLAAWSSRPALTLALTLFDRRPVHPDIDRVLGDFTSVLPLAHEPGPRASFGDSVRRLQDQLSRDLEHRDAPVLDMLRGHAGARSAGEAVLPVVFTSALGVDDDLSDALRRPVWSVSQTPQVWLDEQVMVRDGGLLLTWDAVPELFPAGLLDAMFGAHDDLLDWICRADWSHPRPDLLPSAQRAVRDKVNATTGPLADTALHTGFFARAAAAPDRTALRWGRDGALGYGRLADRALRVAALLRSRGVRSGDAVAVTVPKGPDQIAAVLGVLAAGAAYVPVGPDQPPARRDRMLARAGVRFALTPADIGPAARHEPLAEPDRSSADATAYVIHTSGTTGDPKGVEISHRAAANTVADVNERFGVGPGDVHLAVSALDFDLSVYDIFGPLTAGGCVALIEEDERRDPERWLQHIERHGVTVWNSVPTLLDMLLTTTERLPGSVRLALVSGDWVGLDLHPRLLDRAPGCRMIALGGATEAAIWSNHWEVTGVPPHWTSIPYGRPLRNQCFRVMDPFGHDRPDWVAGELWIGGAGVATGYRGDPARTAEKFVRHADGVRYYRTGDLGRYWPDGTLEFLGRTDLQAKINGHRIEPGEIEAALAGHPAVSRAVVVPAGPRGAVRAHAFVTTTDGSGAPAGLDAFLAERLPAYAHPHTVTVLDGFPLTANGKVDRTALAAAVPESGARVPDGEGPRGPVETAVARLWCELLGLAAVPRDATFFALGGDSLSATRLVRMVRDRLADDITLRHLLAEPTVAGLAALIERHRPGTGSDDTEDGTL